MKIGVIGCGYVGLVTAAGLASIGHYVLATDKDEKKLLRLANGELPIYEPGLEELVKSVTGVANKGELLDLRQGHHVLRWASIQETINRSDVLFICVGTPPLRNGGADLSAIDEVAGYVSEFAEESKLLVEKSTVPAGTGKALARALASRLRRAAAPHKVASNPEFLRESSAVTDFLLPDRIVVGVEDDESRHLLGEVYQPILAKVCGTKFIVTTIESAELIKHASNSFLAMKISYANLISDVAEKVGANVEQVLHAVGLDPRIGEQFLRPGLGFGGFCLPKDLKAFHRLAILHGVDAKLLEATEEMNESRVPRLVEKVRESLWTLNGKTIATLGLSFKPGTDDVRYSQADATIRALIEEGAQIRATDPIVKSPGVIRVDPSQFRYYPNAPYEAVRGADALVILTEWPEYRRLDWVQVRVLMARPVIVDGRNMLSAFKMRAFGFNYLSFGRPSAQ